MKVAKACETQPTSAFGLVDIPFNRPRTFILGLRFDLVHLCTDMRDIFSDHSDQQHFSLVGEFLERDKVVERGKVPQSLGE